MITEALWGKDVLLLSFYSWEQQGIYEHTLCFFPRISASYQLYSRGMRENMVRAPWIWAVRLGRMSHGNGLVMLLRHLRCSYILSNSCLHKKIQGELETCFPWNYAARIVVKHFLFAVGETHFMTAVVMCKKMVVKYSCPAEEDGSGVPVASGGNGPMLWSCIVLCERAVFLL